jgi:uncharacterized ion transporter superfamily protein YfcC
MTIKKVPYVSFSYENQKTRRREKKKNKQGDHQNTNGNSKSVHLMWQSQYVLFLLGIMSKCSLYVSFFSENQVRRGADQ